MLKAVCNLDLPFPKKFLRAERCEVTCKKELSADLLVQSSLAYPDSLGLV